MTEKAKNVPKAEADWRYSVVTDPNANYSLDGFKAKIYGYRLAFAHVARADGKGGVVEFSWPTVRHIIENKGGKFFS